MNNNNPYHGAYSRRFSNMAASYTRPDMTESYTKPLKGVRVITTANDRSMGDVKITSVDVLQAVNHDVYVSQTNTTYSNYTPDSGNSYAIGTRITVEAKPYPGYKFVHWGDGNTDRKRVFTLDRNMTLVAYFAPINASNGGSGGNGGTSDRVAKVVWDGRMGSVSGNGLVLGSETPASSGSITTGQGNTVRLTATPKDGFHFVKWVGGPSNGTQNTPAYTFQMNNNYTIKAVFEGDKVAPSGGDEGHGDGTGESLGSGDSDHVLGGDGVAIDPDTAGSGVTVVGTVGKKDSDLMAFVKKWWWAILIVAYIVYKEGKGGSK